MANQNTIEIWTDGACSGNPGPAGCGVVLSYTDNTKEIKTFLGPATNNIAELTAIKIALQALKRTDIPIRLFTDSQYSMGVLSRNWKAKANRSLILEIKQLMTRFSSLELIGVRGHSDNEGNNRADMLARQAIQDNK